MVVITESFNKADGAGWDADQTWTTLSGNPTTDTNRADRAGAGARMMVSGSGIGNDQYAQWKILERGGQSVIVRATDDSNLYDLKMDATTHILEIRSRVGTFSTLATGTNPVVNNDVIKLEVSGSAPNITLTGYINDVQEVQITGRSEHNSGNPGALLATANKWADDWEAGDFTPGGGGGGGTTSPNALRMNAGARGNLGVNMTTR